ncbi:MULTISPECIES: LysR substrate-binding domain-containing protein [Cupriavidus]
MRYFVKIVEAGSFSRAAATVFVAQPTLSLQMAELEAELGVTLLQRSARGVRPTAAGEALYREATQILRQIERLPEIVRVTGDEVAGAVRLGVSSSLAPVLAGPFMKACKATLPKVSLNFMTEDSATLSARAVAGQLDLAVVLEAEPTPGLLRHGLFRQRLYLVTRQQAAPAPGTVTLRQVAQEPLILPGAPNATRTLIDAGFAAAGVAPNVVAEANLMWGLLSAVHSGVAVTILPLGDFSAAPGHEGFAATPLEPPLYQTAYIVCAQAGSLPRAADAVRRLFASFIDELLDAGPPAGMERIAPDGEP